MTDRRVCGCWYVRQRDLTLTRRVLYGLLCLDGLAGLSQVNPKENMISIRAARREAAANKEKENSSTTAADASGRVRRKAAGTSLADDIQRACQEANPSTKVSGGSRQDMLLKCVWGWREEDDGCHAEPDWGLVAVGWVVVQAVNIRGIVKKGGKEEAEEGVAGKALKAVSTTVYQGKAQPAAQEQPVAAAAAAQASAVDDDDVPPLV